MLVIEPGTTNLWAGAFTVYNNYGMPNTNVALAETFLNQVIRRVSITPNSANIVNFQTALSSHGVYGSSRTYKANTAYVISVYWRPITHPENTQVALTASNMGGWIDRGTVAVGGGWYRTSAYRPASVSVDKTDNVFFSFKCPTAVADVPIYMDWVCPQIEEAKTIPTSYIVGTRPEGITFSANPVTTGQPFLIEVYIHEEVATWADTSIKTWADLQARTWEMVRLKDF
jgi:hypothetical protein